MGALGNVYICDPRTGCLQHPSASAGPAAGDSVALVGVVARSVCVGRSGTELARQPLGLPEGTEKLSKRQ